MINYEQITDGLITAVGLRKHKNPEYDSLPSNVTFSAGKTLVHHPLLNIENIANSIVNFAQYDYSDYSAVTQYSFGDKIKGSDGNNYLYVDQTPQTGVDPVTDNTGAWEELNLLGEYVEDVFRNSVNEVISEVMAHKAKRYETKSLLQYEKIYQGQGRIQDTIINKSSLVGFELTPKRNEGITIMLTQIGTHFTAQTSVDLYLFHTSQLQPLKTITLQHTKPGSFQWHNLNEILKYVDVNQDIDSGGTYFLVYDQDQITGAAVNKRYDYFNSCSFCSAYENNARIERNSFYLIRPVEVINSFREDDGAGNEELFDISKVKHLNNTTFGLNLAVQAKCDITDILLDQKEEISTLLATKIKINFLKEFSMNTRTNQIEEAVRKQANFALQNKELGGEGLLQKYEKLLNKFDYDLSSLSTRCFPKKREGRSIRTKSNSLYY